LARRTKKSFRRFLSARLVARGALMLILAAVLAVVGFHALRFAGACFTLDGAREAIETHVKGKHVRRMARVLKAADRGLLMARTAVRVTALTCGPSLLGGMTCRARYVVNGQNPGTEAADHYFRMGYSMGAGWETASVTETSGLRYSLTPGRCSWGGDGR
jgi:hypothetical protein